MKVGRNDPCPCGSGKKYKHCCYAKDSVKHVPETEAEAEEQVDASVVDENEMQAGGEAAADDRRKDFGHEKGRGRFHGNPRGGSGSFSPRIFRGSQRGN